MNRNEKLAFISLTVFILGIVFLCLVGIRVNVNNDTANKIVEDVCPLFELPIAPPAPVLHTPQPEVLENKTMLAHHLFEHVKEQQRYINNTKLEIRVVYDKYRACHDNLQKIQKP